MLEWLRLERYMDLASIKVLLLRRSFLQQFPPKACCPHRMNAAAAMIMTISVTPAGILLAAPVN